MNRSYYAHYAIDAAEQMTEENNAISKIGRLFSNIGLDDIILMGILFILITEDEPDIVTILALIYIFWV